MQHRGDPGGRRLVAVGDGDEHGAAVGQLGAGGRLGLGERGREVAGDPHHLAGRAHLRARAASRRPAKRSNGSTTSLTHTWPLVGVRGQVEVGDPLAEHDPAGELGQRQPDRLGHERHRARGARVGLDHVQTRPSPWIANWTLSRPTTPSARAMPLGLLADLGEHLLAERVRREHAGRVAGMDPGLLDVLHDPGDPDVVAVAQGVDVDLDRVLQEAVEVDRARRPWPDESPTPTRSR